MYTDRLQSITAMAENLLQEASKLREMGTALQASDEVSLEDTDILKHSVVSMANTIASIGPNIRAIRAMIGSNRKRK